MLKASLQLHLRLKQLDVVFHSELTPMGEDTIAVLNDTCGKSLSINKNQSLRTCSARDAGATGSEIYATPLNLIGLADKRAGV
jgi:hypothetical protein